MAQEQRQLEDKRGLRFPFNADAEVVLPSASEKILARVTELSFRGCFLEISAALQEKQRVRVRTDPRRWLPQRRPRIHRHRPRFPRSQPDTRTSYKDA